MTILKGKKIPFEYAFLDLIFLLLRISVLFEYDQSGRRTDRVVGYVYECVDTVNFEKIRVKIKTQEDPIMDDADLQKLRENGEKVAVEFIKGTVTPYWNQEKRSLEDSFYAEGVRLVVE